MCADAATRLSIVVPALDEEATITASLSPLQRLRAAGHEVVVVDGGSADRTLELAAPLADRTLVAPRGRAMQMNAGARLASNDVLLFLHADTRLPEDGVNAIAGALARGYRWGRFDVTLEGNSVALPLVGRLINLRSRFTGIATGDQAIFVTRAAFERAGGFAEITLMEDIALSKTLKRAVGRPACLTQRVITSGRRWDANGALATILQMWRLRFDYWRGVHPALLAQRYGARPRTTPVLHVFAKDAVPGRVKTRLATAIGVDAAARLYVRLAERTLGIAAAARDDGVVRSVELWCDPDPHAALFRAWRDRYGVALHAQCDGDLGRRMRFALSSSLDVGTPSLLIGTDAPALDVAYLRLASEALSTRDAVLGAAEDGGYVLVGLARPADIFSGIAWSTDEVMAATRAKLAHAGLTWAELPTLWDVDTSADLERYREWERRAAAA